MNWYKKFLKFASINRFDSIAISLCKDIFQDLRILYFSGQLFHNSLKYRNQRFEDIIKNILEKQNKSSKEININVTVYRKNNTRLRFGTFDIEGRAQDNSDFYGIDIEIYIGSSFVIENFSQIYNFLFNVVRHEIQHILDKAEGRVEAEQRNSNVSYFIQGIRMASENMTSSIEIVPCIRGIMLGSKKQHVSFSDRVRQAIKENFYFNNSVYENQLKSSGFSSQLVSIENDTYSRIMEKARTIFPNL